MSHERTGQNGLSEKVTNYQGSASISLPAVPVLQNQQIPPSELNCLPLQQKAIQFTSKPNLPADVKITKTQPFKLTSQLKSDQDTSVTSKLAPLQLRVVDSALFSAKTAGLKDEDAEAIEGAFRRLDDQVPNAVQNADQAIKDIKNNVAVPTARQSIYLSHKTPKAWGYVIEEQLDLLANEWVHQSPLVGARPDYTQKINNISVYADLTTEKQAGSAGNHVTEKLLVAKINPGHAVAADITHDNAMPPIEPLPGWRLEALASRQLHKASSPKNFKIDGAYSEMGQKRVPKESKVMAWEKSRCLRYIEDVKKFIDQNPFEDTDGQEVEYNPVNHKRRAGKRGGPKIEDDEVDIPQEVKKLKDADPEGEINMFDKVV